MARIAAAQTPEFREDVDGALAHASATIDEAHARGAALLCFPEGYLQGYLTEEAAARRCALDLASPEFEAVLARLPRSGLTVVMGLIELDADHLFNTAVVVCDGALLGRYRKTHLLRGERAFTPGDEAPIFQTGGLRFGINICYDTNFPEAARKVADGGAQLIVCPANNMMPRPTAETWKHEHNRARGARCIETGLWLLSADVTGERDGRIAWGPTAVLGPTGAVAAELPLGAPGLLVFDLPD
ncbi:carbon-nitrogen hydrolase family protein [Phenylobacterium sp.]|uniref:carbon-nitrogen hydrolase family protein n=1 Tax=Phenylobacterium sp. TaxID=1871053 RepID=UPI002E31109D|nr:carbon-nitrogen hydrolase family protein [Phenylobacterium sp.]HEX2561779.1 carbon-nitrogen hydrolase family protein [Phenylobacterium sp.]